MVQAGSASIYRIDVGGDTEATAKTANQIIEFNGGDNPDAKSFLERVNHHWVEDISKHPNPNKALDRLHDSLLGTRSLILEGWFEDPDNAGALVRLSNWMGDPKTNTALEFGRFGVRVDDFSNLDIAPSATVAWMLYDAEVDIPPDHPYECNFTLRLWLNGTHP